MADSHGRDLGHLTEQKSAFNVCSHVRPGATFGQVVHDVKVLTKELGKGDYVLVIAGTNNFGRTGTKEIAEEARSLIMNTQHTNLILATVPMREDVPIFHLKISKANRELENIIEGRSNVKLLPLHLLPCHSFTKHGLHFNKRGKRKVAEEIVSLLSKQNKNTYLQFKNNSLQTTIRAEEEINVFECDMRKTIAALKNDSSVAFSHTISADLQHPKNMSAGVAVIFKEIFGRPSSSDFVEDKLTCQNIPNGGVVYSLITKENFHEKPTETDYNIAFSQLTQDFKTKGFKTLVCSPMGCVRDHIKLQHFAKNIVRFQEETNSVIYICSYNQKSRFSVLRKGLTHQFFLEKLKQEISREKQCATREKSTNNLTAVTAHSTPQPSPNKDPVDITDPSPVPQTTQPQVGKDNSSFLENQTLLDIRNSQELIQQKT